MPDDVLLFLPLQRHERYILHVKNADLKNAEGIYQFMKFRTIVSKKNKK